MLGRSGDDAIFEGVTGLEAEDADRFDANVVVGGEFFDGGVGRVSNGAGKNVGGSAIGVRDVRQGNFDGLKAAVVVEIQARKLANTEFAVDFDEGVNFLAGIAIGFEAVFGFEELDLSGVWRFGGFLF